MSRMWYYSDKKQQKGPIPFEELRGLAHSGYIRPADLVWEEGSPDWIRASLVDGLFDSQAGAGGGGDGGATRERDRDLGGRDRDRDRGYDDEPRGRRRDEPLDDRPRRREPSRRPQGMSSGLKIGLIVGGIALVLIVIAVILIIVLSGSSSGGAGGTYTITLRGGQSDVRTFTFPAGKNVECRVNTVVIGGFNTDVDIDVFDPAGIPIAGDHGFSKDCFCTFRATRAGVYRVEVRNLGPGDARSTVTVR